MLRIGICGHRYLAEEERITTGIKVALERIACTCGAPPWVIRTSLAQGADCLAASLALQREDTVLEVLLPFPVDEFLGDFDNPTSRGVFNNLLMAAKRVDVLAPQHDREEAYLKAGQLLAESCDVLLAIWDGKSAHGAAGTGTVVERARILGLPLAWVHAGNRLPGSTKPTSLGREQGKTSFERWG